MTFNPSVHLEATTTVEVSSLYHFCLPDIGEGIAEGELLEWLVKPGDVVHEDQPLFEVMTDKVTVEIPSPVGGVVQKLLFNVGEQVPVGAALLTLQLNSLAKPLKAEPLKPILLSTQQAIEPPQATPTAFFPKALSAQVPVLASPATRSLARKKGVDLTQLQGSGPQGRILASDVETAAAQQNTLSQPSYNISSELAPSNLPSKASTFKPYSGLRRLIGQRMAQSHATIPPFTLVEQVNVSTLVVLKQRLAPRLQEKAGVKLTYLPFFLKAVAEALRIVPALNARFDEAQQRIEQFAECNLSVAMETPQGVVVPVIRQVEALSILQLAQQVTSVHQQVRANQLPAQAMEGGQFTVTSLGNFGSLMGCPVVPPGQVGIVGFHAIKTQPVVLPDGHTLGVGQVLHISLSADHRVVDGMDGGRFLASLKTLLEAPEALLL